MTDEQLVARFIDGDTTAFNALARRWQRPIYNFILKYSGDREDAGDLCQKTMIRAFRSLDRLRDPDRFSSWLYQIAVNISRDGARNRKLRSTVPIDSRDPDILDGIREMATDGRDHPDAAAHGRDVRELLSRALQAIPEEQRVVVVMKEYQGLRFTEIAEALQIPINTAKSRMYYGLSALRKLFDQWKIDEEMLGYDM